MASIPGRGRASHPRWHCWSMPEHLVNPGAKRSRSAKRPQSCTGLLQAAQPQGQVSCPGCLLVVWWLIQQFPNSLPRSSRSLPAVCRLVSSAL